MAAVRLPAMTLVVGRAIEERICQLDPVPDVELEHPTGAVVFRALGLPSALVRL